MVLSGDQNTLDFKVEPKLNEINVKDKQLNVIGTWSNSSEHAFHAFHAFNSLSICIQTTPFVLKPIRSSVHNKRQMSSHQFYYRIDMMDCTRTYAYIYGFLVDDAGE